jgi:hypothetical protein
VSNSHRDVFSLVPLPLIHKRACYAGAFNHTAAVLVSTAAKPNYLLGTSLPPQSHRKNGLVTAFAHAEAIR